MSNILPSHILREIDEKLASLRSFIAEEPKRVPRVLIGDLSRGDFAALPLDRRLATVRARMIDAEIDRLHAEATAAPAPAAAAEVAAREEPGGQRFQPGEAVRPCPCRCGLYVSASSRSPYDRGHAPKPRSRKARGPLSRDDVLNVPSQTGEAVPR